jgi:acetyl/propionyl-CoA carboxylase alpha subunit
MRYVVTVNDQELEVALDGSLARVGDTESVEAHLADVEGTPVRVATIGGRVYRALVQKGATAGKVTLHLGGFRFEVEALDERTRAIRQLSGVTSRAAGPASLVAPMPGLVVRVLIEPGDRVQAGQGVVVIEAMKMENELRTRAPGIVRSVAVAPGSAVEKGA